jgi:hypothetical protein
MKDIMENRWCVCGGFYGAAPTELSTCQEAWCQRIYHDFTEIINRAEGCLFKLFKELTWIEEHLKLCFKNQKDPRWLTVPP